MSRERSGSVEWVEPKKNETQGHYKCRISLNDGVSRPWVHLKPSVRSENAEKRAEEKAAEWSERAKRENLTAADFKKIGRSTAVASEPRGGKTVKDYAGDWIKARTGRVRSVDDNASHLEHHVLPVLGRLEIARVTRADVERFVGALDAKVRKGELSAKTVKHIWGTCSKMFDDATNAKPADGLRCLETDPTVGVRGPDDDDADKLLQFLYPSEFSTFIACEDVPIAWRRNVAIAVYLCLRDGEQRALKWPAVDLEHGVITIAETYDRRAGADREGTKGGAARQVPIRSELLPLLEAMHEESGGSGYVCTLPSLRDMARGLRRWLDRAGVKREQLHFGSTVSKKLRWHDLRATGLTWLAVEGRNATEIRDVAGHTQTSMTDRYMRSAGVLRGGRFGAPFPPLPAALLTDADEVEDEPEDASIAIVRSVPTSPASAGFEGGSTAQTEMVGASISPLHAAKAVLSVAFESRPPR
jgi:integrase